MKLSKASVISRSCRERERLGNSQPLGPLAIGINTKYNPKIQNISLINCCLGGEELTKCSLVLGSETFFWPWDVIVMGTWQSLRDSLSVKRSLSLVIWLSLQLYQKVGGSQDFTINISVLGEELFHPNCPVQSVRASSSTSRTSRQSLGTAVWGRKLVVWRRLRCDQWVLVSDWMRNFPSEIGRRLSPREEAGWGGSRQS